MGGTLQLYTLAFFIMVSTILMNIIFGVIIDTFAELRARKVLMTFLRQHLALPPPALIQMHYPSTSLSSSPPPPPEWTH